MIPPRRATFVCDTCMDSGYRYDTFSGKSVPCNHPELRKRKR